MIPTGRSRSNGSVRSKVNFRDANCTLDIRLSLLLNRETVLFNCYSQIAKPMLKSINISKSIFKKK